MSPDRWQRVNDLFQAAVEREPPERNGFLAHACAGDAALMAEVANLVAAHERAGLFIEVPALGGAVQLLAAAERGGGQRQRTATVG